MSVEPRVIPALLLSGERLVKTRQFTDPVYVGDPVNVLSIFNDFEVDEIFIADIDAARSRRPSSLELLGRLATECFIPLAYGGGVSDVETARAIVAAGFEKIVVNTAIVEQPRAVERMVASLGSQAIVASVDARLTASGYRVFTRGGSTSADLSVEEWAVLAQRLGVGEVLVTSIDREGTRTGFDLDLVKHVTSVVDMPVVAHGGADRRSDLVGPVRDAQASAVAAGSLFVFQGDRSSVLVNYPSRETISGLFGLADSTAADSEGVESALAPSPPDLVRGSGAVLKRCARCLITPDVPGAQLEDSDVCYYCGLHDVMDAQYPVDSRGRAALELLAQRLRAAGRGKQYDCILGVSGGCDSSYLAHLLVELGVRPLAVHFDNTWNSPVATSNIYAVLEKLDIPLETYVVDNDEYDDIYRAFIRAGVRDIEAPTDIGFMGVLYRAAEKHRIKHIIEGHSFRTEGVSPLGWLYMDGGYVKSVHAQFGTVPMRTYPNMDFLHFVKWAALSGIERVRPLYWVDYRKEEIKEFLTQEYGWQWYGGHHLENRFTAFYHSYFLPQRFGIDFRVIEFSALVRSGQLDRETGLARLHEDRDPQLELVALVKKRLGLSEQEFCELMAAPRRTYRDYATYKRRFELLRAVFWVLYKLDRVPKSFYVKFCLPAPRSVR